MHTRPDTRGLRRIPPRVAARCVVLALIAACGPNELGDRGDTGTGTGDDGDGTRERTGELRWERTIDVGAVDAAQTVIIGSDGSVIVGGGATTGATGQDAWIAALDPEDGSTLWTWTYNGPGDGNDVIQDLAVSPGGELTGVGNVTQNPGDDGRNFFVVRLDAGGQTLWTRTTSSGVGFDTFSGVIEYDEQLVAAGRSVDAITDRPRGWLEWIHLDDGASLEVSETGDDAYWIDIAAGDDGFVVVGRRSAPAGQTAVWAFAREPWQLDPPFESVLGEGIDTLNGVAAAPGGLFAVTGVSPRLEAPDAVFVGTLQPDGKINQSHVFDGREPEAGDAGSDVAVDPWGDVVVVGKQSEAAGDRALVSKRTPGEPPVWTHYKTAAEGATAASVAIGDDGSIFVVGSTVDGDGAGGRNIWVVKYAP